MAVQINTQLSGEFLIKQVCSDSYSFDITDKSGIFSNTVNPGGWGGANPDISNVSSCTITINLQSGESFTYDIKSIDFPNIINSPKRVKVDFPLTDGIYEFVYNLSGNFIQENDVLWKVTNTKYFLFCCEVQCCIDNMILKTNILSCDNCKDELSAVMRAYMFLEGAKLAACCGNVKIASALLAQAKLLCSKLKCDGC